MITIREATSEDVDIVYELIIAIAKYHGQEQYVNTDKNELLISGFGESQKYVVLLAEVEGEVAGYVSYTWNYSIWLGSRYMSIDDVFVWQEYRGQKVGEVLMHKARDVCRAHEVTRIRWEVQNDNHAAIKFYKRLGATLVGEYKLCGSILAACDHLLPSNPEWARNQFGTISGRQG